MEAWRSDRDPPGVQDNLSWSCAGVLRGLHFQQNNPQGKWIRVLQGQIFDIAIDLRPGPTWLSQHPFTLTHPTQALWIPPGFAHGFYALCDALVWYRLSCPRVPGDERCLRWDDPQLAIPWPLVGPPLLSERDATAPTLAELLT